MKCPFCGSLLNRVVDKRSVSLSGEIRRRRECLKCQRRFTTYEKMGALGLVVLKKDGRREPFLRDKLKKGLLKALEKRPAVNKIDDLAERIERKLRKRGNQEVSSKMIGQIVLSELKRLDSIAYLRFASVYRQFERPEDFAREVSSLVD
ncbi:MAG: transcriptional regulator NrdR [bacterium]|nr:transcriptional regulator NrdR [bacterium]